MPNVLSLASVQAVIQETGADFTGVENDGRPGRRLKVFGKKVGKKPSKEKIEAAAQTLADMHDGDVRVAITGCSVADASPTPPEPDAAPDE